MIYVVVTPICCPTYAKEKSIEPWIRITVTEKSESHNLNALLTNFQLNLYRKTRQIWPSSSTPEGIMEKVKCPLFPGFPKGAYSRRYENTRNFPEKHQKFCRKTSSTTTVYFFLGGYFSYAPPETRT